MSYLLSTKRQMFRLAQIQSFCKRQNEWFNSLPNDKITDWFKVKALADDKSNANKKSKFGLGSWKILREKEKMLVTSIFSFFHNVFKMPLSQGR